MLHLLTNSINNARMAKVIGLRWYLSTEGRPGVSLEFDLANVLIYFLCAHVGRRRGDYLDVAVVGIIADWTVRAIFVHKLSSYSRFSISEG